MSDSSHKPKVVIGLSGGVDSSVSAHLLNQQGYEVIALYMRNWNDESVTIHNECPWIDDANDAISVANHLGIPFQVIDLSVQYKERIVDYMFAEYKAGRTPNPDILCNREIKFDVFLKHALSLGADYVATGHYCQKIKKDGQFYLKAGADNNKDQSYFLCQISQEQLAKILFPIGHLQKSEVREIASNIDLPNATKKDSQGLCFVGKISLPTFLSATLKPLAGNIVELTSTLPKLHQELNSIEDKCAGFEFNKSDGKVLGQHDGAHYYTVGQRRGLRIGGSELPLFVVQLDAKENIVYVAKGENHPALNRIGLKIKSEDVHWLNINNEMKNDVERKYKVRIRYRQPLVEATLTMKEDYLYIVFDQLMKAIAPGQFAAWYEDDICIGSGIIY
jgi:tRNA-uridine 2-sulfurtransferase